MDFVLSCQHENGGFGAAPGHDAHMLYTVSAVQILGTVDAVEELDRRGKTGKETVGRCGFESDIEKESKLKNIHRYCRPTESRDGVLCWR